MLPIKHCISIQDLVIDLNLLPAGNKFRGSSLPLHCLIETGRKTPKTGEAFTISFSVSKNKLNGGRLSLVTGGFEARVQIRFLE
jgi:hypothetical protein